MLAFDGVLLWLAHCAMAKMSPWVALWLFVNTLGDAPAVMRATAPVAWLPGEESQGACNVDREGRLLSPPREEADAEDEADPRIDGAVEREEREGDRRNATNRTAEIGRGAAGPFVVSRVGPSGSDHLWETAVSFKQGGVVVGFCLLTETSAWRHIGANPSLADEMAPLIRPIQDVDGDHLDELVIAESVDPGDGAPCAEGAPCVLSARAYDRLGTFFVVDVASTSTLRLKMASAYDRAAASRRSAPSSRKLYERAAVLLKKLGRVLAPRAP